MNVINRLIDNIKAAKDQLNNFFISIPLKSYITFILEAIGLFANLIAIGQFIIGSKTSPTSTNFYVNYQEAFVWSLIAAIYGISLMNAKFQRRWRKITISTSSPDAFDSSFSSEKIEGKLFTRNLCFTLAIVFPISFLYIRAIQMSIFINFVSPWLTLLTTVLLCIPITIVILITTLVMDYALSLYSGD